MSCSIPDGFRFHIGHLWMKPGDSSMEVFVGITDFAQKQLGKIIFVDLPRIGDVIQTGQPFGAVESSKVVSELVAPVSGEVLETNVLLKQSAGLVNEDCYGAGWIAKVGLAEVADLSELLSHHQYLSILGERAR
jgi:glycine cleavage system H protein